jgi:hypothetical protein
MILGYEMLHAYLLLVINRHAYLLLVINRHAYLWLVE